MRAAALYCAAFLAAQPLHAQTQPPLPLLDVPFLSQSELLCGGAAAAMVLRYWGERGVTAETFADLVDRSASGIRTDVLIGDLMRRGWRATPVTGSAATLRAEVARGRPVLILIEDRPSAFHYVVVVAAHERGVVFHDPARAPFMVMSAVEFERRWNAADRWMAVVVPGPDRITSPPPETPTALVTSSFCADAVVEGVRLAQANDLAGAERTLSGAVGCPAALRELAGVRVLQKRWAEAADLASAAVRGDREDAYAWKVLATSRFVQNDRLGALAAWNQVDEPRIDLVRFDGLSRTRHRAVEQLVRVSTGEVLSPGEYIRASRRLGDLPSATATRLEYIPVRDGLAELRGVIAERPVMPRDRISFAALGVSTAVTREVRLTTGSLVGGGERIDLAWRFWPHRPRVSLAIEAPAPWGGVWSVQAYTERQPFTASEVAAAEQTGGGVGVSNWIAPRWRWTIGAGVDEWAEVGTRGRAAGALQFVSVDRRVEATLGADVWSGASSFTVTDARVQARTSAERLGLILIASAGVETASRSTPLNLWPAGDTGHVRASLLRAHPVLDGGRLRVERLGRTFLHTSIEVQHWWRVAGPVRAAAAALIDIGRTAQRTGGHAQTDADVGIGGRLAVPAIPGILRLDAAKGLRDGAFRVSLVYQP